MQNEIQKYCDRKGITMDILSNITKVSVPQLYCINRDPTYNITIKTINKIWRGTKKAHGKGLSASKYLDYPCFK